MEAITHVWKQDLVKKPFFPSLLSYMTSGPVVPMVWEGDGVVAAGRVILGATKPSESAPGTVRGDYAIDVGRNVCHGSDAVDTAKVHKHTHTHTHTQTNTNTNTQHVCIHETHVGKWYIVESAQKGSSQFLFLSAGTFLFRLDPGVLTPHEHTSLSSSPFSGAFPSKSDALSLRLQTEIGLWFKDGLTKWDSHSESWVYE